MDRSWIVTANASIAHFFSQENASSGLKEIHDIANANAHQLTTESESDRLGQHAASKSRHSVGAPTQPSGYQPHQSPAEHSTEIFAREVASYLQQNHQQGRFRNLVLVASPEFLGTLRKQLGSNLSAVVSLEINKDYTQINPEELHKHLKKKVLN
jgi:protein required for attachment to host cells